MFNTNHSLFSAQTLVSPIFLHFVTFFEESFLMDPWLTKTQFWTQGVDAMLHGVEVTRLDAMDHGVELSGRAQRGVCVAVYVAKKILDAADHGVDL